MLERRGGSRFRAQAGRIQDPHPQARTRQIAGNSLNSPVASWNCPRSAGGLEPQPNRAKRLECAQLAAASVVGVPFNSGTKLRSMAAASCALSKRFATSVTGDSAKMRPYRAYLDTAPARSADIPVRSNVRRQPRPGVEAGLAADRNVRAPGAVSRCARPYPAPLNRLDPAGGPDILVSTSAG